MSENGNFYRDEFGLFSDDFRAFDATDEQLMERWQNARKGECLDDAMMLVMCSSELGKRGYTLTEDETEWIAK